MTTNQIEVEALARDFHDATLLRIEFEWERGVAIITTLDSDGQKRLIIDGVVHLECARSFPWGRSVSINRVEVTAGPADTLLISIEMQSGDMLALRGSSIRLA